jgi:hypothetical protein
MVASEVNIVSIGEASFVALCPLFWPFAEGSYPNQ